VAGIGTGPHETQEEAFVRRTGTDQED